MLDPNDTHSQTDNDCYGEFYRIDAVRWTFLVVLTLLIIFTVVGNALVCIALFVDRSLRTPANIFLLNMSVGDLIITGTVIFTDYVYLIYFPTWKLGSLGNWMYNIGFVALLIIPFLTLIAVTIDRYLSIIRPLRYAVLVTRRRVGICLAILWGYTVLAVTLIALFVFSKDVSDDSWVFLLSNPYYVILILCHTLLPLIIIIILYIRLYLIARHHSRQILALSQRFTAERATSLRFMIFEWKATQTVFIVIVVLMLSWLPLILNETLSFFYFDEVNCTVLKLGAVANYVTYFNGALNPIVYALRHRRFFLVFKKIMFCNKSIFSRRGIVAPSTVITNAAVLNTVGSV